MEGQNEFELLVPTATERSRRAEIFETRQQRKKETRTFNQLKSTANAKAELNHRSQTCEVRADTGISRRGKMNR